MLLRKLFLCAGLLLLTQCSKCKQDDPAPLDQLPPATQTGANTFGCLVNGRAYVPNPRYDDNVVLYEPGISLPIGGNLNIQTSHNVQQGNSNTEQAITLAAGPIRTARTYSLNSPNAEGTAIFNDRSKAYPCNYYGNAAVVYRRGQITITRIDEQAHVLSGTFEFTLAQPGCDTIKVTQGRFDYKI